MSIENVVASINSQIANLKQARALLSGGETAKRTPGRPKGSAIKAKTKKRNMTPEGRKAIADAVRRRWAAQKKAAKA
jgi:hypothetical protein